MKTPSLSNNISTWPPLRCSPSSHILITLVVTGILASLSLVCYLYGLGGKITPALLGVASAFSIAISIMLIPYRENKNLVINVPLKNSPLPPVKIKESITTSQEESTFDENALIEDTPPTTPPQQQPSPPKPRFGIPEKTDRSVISPTPVYVITEETIINIYERSHSFQELNASIERLNSSLCLLPDSLKYALVNKVCHETDRSKQKFSVQILDVILPTMDSKRLHQRCNENGNTFLHTALLNNLEAAKKLIRNKNSDLTTAHLQLAAKTNDTDLMAIFQEELTKRKHSQLPIAAWHAKQKDVSAQRNIPQSHQ